MSLVSTHIQEWRKRSSQIRLRLPSNRSAIGKSIMLIVYHLCTLPGHEPLNDNKRDGGCPLSLPMPSLEK